MKKQTLLLLLFLIALTILGTLSLVWQNRKYNTFSNHSAEDSFPHFKPEDIRKVEISWRTTTTDLVFQDGHWMVKRPEGEIQANTGRVVELLNALSAVRPLKEIRNFDADTLKKLRLLDQTSNKELPGLRISLFDANGKLYDLILGKGHFTRDLTTISGYQTETPNGRYVLLRRNGQPERAFLISRVFESVTPSLVHWMEMPQLHDASQVLSFRVRDPRNDQVIWEAFRDSTSQPFRFRTPENLAIDMAMLSRQAEPLTKPYGTGLAEPGVSFVPDTELLLTLSNGYSYVLQFAIAPEGQALTRIRLTFDKDKAVRFPQETKEQFALRLTNLASRAEYEKRMEKNLYITRQELPALLRKIPVAGTPRRK